MSEPHPSSGSQGSGTPREPASGWHPAARVYSMTSLPALIFAVRPSDRILIISLRRNELYRSHQFLFKHLSRVRPSLPTSVQPLLSRPGTISDLLCCSVHVPFQLFQNYRANLSRVVLDLHDHDPREPFEVVRQLHNHVGSSFVWPATHRTSAPG
jgi:hypothetical protein